MLGAWVEKTGLSISLLCPAWHYHAALHSHMFTRAPTLALGGPLPVMLALTWVCRNAHEQRYLYTLHVARAFPPHTHVYMKMLAGHARDQAPLHVLHPHRLVSSPPCSLCLAGGTGRGGVRRVLYSSHVYGAGG